MISFAILSGLRLQNVIRLTWKDIDYEAQTLTVRTKSRRPGGNAHTMPLTPAMVALTISERGNHPIYIFTYKCKRSRGKRRKGQRYPFSESGWRKDFKKALAAAGIYDFRFHDLRHTFTTRLLRATGNLKLTQKALGHRNIGTTVKYAHVLVDEIRDGMAKVPNYSRTIPEPSINRRNGRAI